MRFDDFRPVTEGEPQSYGWVPLGPIIAVPIVAPDESALGYVFHGVGEESGYAGTVQLVSDERADAACRFWEFELRAHYQAGVSAQDAVTSLIGRASPDSKSRVKGAKQEFAGRAHLDELLNPEVYERKRRWHERREQERRAAAEHQTVRPTRADIDAALRGQQPMTPVIAAAVRNLDAALAKRPVPEPLVVTVLWERSDLPTVLEASTRSHESAFMLSYLASPDRQFPEADVRMQLRVEPGIPALFQEPSTPGAPAILILGRGIEWEVTQTVALPDQLAVFARTVGVRAADVDSQSH